MDWKVIVIVGGIVLSGSMIGALLVTSLTTPKLIMDPACRDIEAKYQALIKEEGPDAQPAIATKAEDQE